MLIGVDIGGTSVKIGHVIKNNIDSFIEESVSFDDYKTPIIDTVVKSVDNFVKINNINMNEIRGIAVSATGQIDSTLGKVIGGGGHIQNWIGTNIKEVLQERYKKNVTVINDANSMIIAEHSFGAAKGYKNAIGITIGTGVGGGIIIDNKLLSGSRGLAGEIGHMVLSAGEDMCPCGSVGCYELYASMNALVRSVTEEINNTNIEINGRYIFSNYDNPIIQGCVKKWIKNISLGIVSLVHIFNPDIIVVGGGVSSQNEKFLRPLQDEVKKYAFEKFQEDLMIVPAEYNNNAGILGAVSYFNETFK